jgi:glyoxylase-like metal-dependent hydrolase (beta-lactamase superfamily II)
MNRITLGNFELTIVSDGTYYLDGGAFFGVVPKPMWSTKATPDDQNRLDAGLNSLLIRTGDKNILVETGIGNKLPEKMAQIYKQPAQLLDNLHGAGLAPEDIDIVINTHLHFDHCGWNTVRRGDGFAPTFPKAKYYVQRGEWEHGRRQLERDAVSYMSPNYDPLLQTGQMELLDGDREIVPGVSVKVFRGHTAHMRSRVRRSITRAPSPSAG